MGHVKNKHFEVYKKMGRKKNVKRKLRVVGGTEGFEVGKVTEKAKKVTEKVTEQITEVPKKIPKNSKLTNNEFKVPKNIPKKFKKNHKTDKNAILADEPQKIQRKRKETAQLTEITPTKLTRKALKELNANLKIFEK